MSEIFVIAAPAPQPQLLAGRMAWVQVDDWLYVREDHNSPHLMQGDALFAAARGIAGGSVFRIRLRNRESVAEGARRGLALPLSPPLGDLPEGVRIATDTI